MIKSVIPLMFASAVLVCANCLPAAAAVIDFETQADHKGGNLTGTPDSPLIIGFATFTGGELREQEVGLPADQTGVYASEGLFGSGETNPLMITFASPVTDFSVFVANAGDAGSYTVSDNLGDSITKSLALAGDLGATTISLPGIGVTAVNITSANANAWDFAIDNVAFTATPEPKLLPLLAAGLVLVIAVCRLKQAKKIINPLTSLGSGGVLARSGEAVRPRRLQP
jgi:hypothetical protein